MAVYSISRMRRNDALCQRHVPISCGLLTFARRRKPCRQASRTRTPATPSRRLGNGPHMQGRIAGLPLRRGLQLFNIDRPRSGVFAAKNRPDSCIGSESIRHKDFLSSSPRFEIRRLLSDRSVLSSGQDAARPDRFDRCKGSGLPANYAFICGDGHGLAADAGLPRGGVVIQPG